MKCNYCETKLATISKKHKIIIVIIKDNNSTIEYFTFGNGVDNLIILPGLSALKISDSKDYIENRYKLLTNKYKITIIDRPLSPNENYNINAATQDIAKIINQIKANNLTILGFSQGGMIAQKFAINYPNMVKNLILCATSSKTSETTKKKIESWIKAAYEKDTIKLAKLFVHDVYSENTAMKLENNTINALNDISDELLNRFIILAKMCQDFDVKKEINKIVCKTLILGSEGDKLIPLNDINTLSQSIKNSQLFIYDNKYGHAFIDEADDFVERIYRFLEY